MLTLFNCHKGVYALVPWLAQPTHYPPRFVLAEHYHNPYHLVFIAGGTCRLQTDNADTVLAETDIVLIEPGEKHVFRTGPATCRNFAFNFYLLPVKQFNALTPGQRADPETARSFLEKNGSRQRLDTLFAVEKRPPLLQYDRGQWPALMREIDRFYSETGFWHVEDKAERLRNQRWYYYRCARFFDTILSLIAPGPYKPDRTAAAQDPIVSATMTLIDQRLNQPYRLRSIAARMGYSPSYLCTHFARVTGMTPGHYAITSKIRHGCELLRSSAFSVSGIAMETGFCSSQHFSRAFKQVTGYTPREWRHMQRDC